MHERLKRITTDAGLPFVERELRPNSRRALEASEYARSQGKHDEFHKIVFNKLYGYGQDIHDWKVLRAAATESGIDADEMQREVENGKYREELNNLLAEVQALDITIVPTYIINGKYSIVGDQRYEEFIRIIQWTD